MTILDTNITFSWFIEFKKRCKHAPQCDPDAFKWEFHLTSRSKDKWRVTFTGLGGCNAHIHNDLYIMGAVCLCVCYVFSYFNYFGRWIFFNFFFVKYFFSSNFFFFKTFFLIFFQFFFIIYFFNFFSNFFFHIFFLICFRFSFKNFF